MLSYVVTLWMVSEKYSCILFWCDLGKSVACVFYLSGHFQLSVTDTQLKPASKQSGHLLVYKEASDWWGHTGFQGLPCQDASRTCSQGENWLSCGGGEEKCFSVRKLIWKPEARRGKVTGPSSHSFLGVQQCLNPDSPYLTIIWLLPLCPTECIKTDPTGTSLFKFDILAHRSFAHRFQRI